MMMVSVAEGLRFYLRQPVKSGLKGRSWMPVELQGEDGSGKTIQQSAVVRMRCSGIQQAEFDLYASIRSQRRPKIL